MPSKITKTGGGVLTLLLLAFCTGFNCIAYFINPAEIKLDLCWEYLYVFYCWLLLIRVSLFTDCRITPWHPSEICARSRGKIQGQFQGQVLFSANKGRNKCNTLFSCNFHWKIHFLHYFNVSRSFSRSKGQFQGRQWKNIIYKKLS